MWQPQERFLIGMAITHYRFSDEYQFLEFHVSKIKMLEKLNMEVGISTNILEKHNDKTYLRELKVDLTTPKTFQLSDV